MKSQALSLLLLTLPACSTIPEAAGEAPAAPEVIAGTLHELTECYAEGNFECFVALFAEGATYQGNLVADFRDKWREGFNVPGQYWEFLDVNIAKGMASTWFVERSARYCSGPAYWSFDPEGRVRSVEAVCARTDPDAPPVAGGGADPSAVAQGLDIGTTGLALTAGLVEANPLGAVIGAPAFAGVKLVATQAAERLPLGACYQMKNGLSAAGWTGAGWNGCMLLVSPSGPIGWAGCGIAAAVVGAISSGRSTDDGNLMHCWEPLVGAEGGRYQKISAAGMERGDD